MGEMPTPPESSTAEPQPQSTQPSKRKGNRKIIATVLIIIVLASMLGGLAYMYINLANRFNKLESDFKTLQTSHNLLQAEHSQLTTSYQTLTGEYSALNNQYTTLNNQYTTLNTQYTALNNQYSTLSSQYTSLSQNYNKLSQVFNYPLLYDTIPTTSQLDQWLDSDNTDAIAYTSPNFICGDFAVMLSQHAKLKNWDIGIVTVYGYTETYESYGHAFNSMITSEGLVYIEPQNDHYWWYSGHQEIYEGLWWEIDDEWVYVQQFSIVVSYS